MWYFTTITIFWKYGNNWVTFHAPSASSSVSHGIIPSQGYDTPLASWFILLSALKRNFYLMFLVPRTTWANSPLLCFNQREFLILSFNTPNFVDILSNKGVQRLTNVRTVPRKISNFCSTTAQRLYNRVCSMLARTVSIKTTCVVPYGSLLIIAFDLANHWTT